MTVVVTDNCTGVDGTLLNAHTPDTGGPITLHPASTTSTVVITDANRMRTTGSGLALYTYAGTPSSADYTVECDLRCMSTAGMTGQSFGPVGRCDTTQQTCYHLRYSYGGGGVWELRKFVSGTSTLLGSLLQTLTPGTTYHMVLTMTGSTIKGSVDGVELFNVVDSAITAVGKAGVRGGGQDTSNTTGAHIDALQATDGITLAPTNLIAPSITSGTYSTGQTVTCSTGTWSGNPSSFTYQWRRNGSSIAGATAASYTLVSADEGQSINCRVTATNSAGSTAADSNAITPSVTAPLQATDITYNLSGGVGNTNPTQSYGGAKGATVINAAQENIFDRVSEPVAEQGQVDYRLLYVTNNHPVFSVSAAAYIPKQIQDVDADNVELGPSDTKRLHVGAATEAAGTTVTAPASRFTPPNAVSFLNPGSSAGAISLGTLTPGQSKGLWVRRTIDAGNTAAQHDPFQLAVEVTQL